MKQLTNADNPDLQRKVEETPPGMAHWAGTGPVNTYCRSCVFFNGITERDGHAKGQVIKGWCRKTGMLVRAQIGKRPPEGERFPADTRSCRYYEPRGART